MIDPTLYDTCVLLKRRYRQYLSRKQRRQQGRWKRQYFLNDSRVEQLKLMGFITQYDDSSHS